MTLKNFIKIIKYIPPVVPQYFRHLDDQSNVLEEEDYKAHFMEVSKAS